MSSLPRHVLAEVMQRQTKPGDLFATCPFTRKQFADHHKWERGNAAHIVPHAIWAMLGLGSNCEFFANANNIIFVDQLVHFNLEAYNTIPSFSLQPYGKTFPHRRSRIHTRGRQEFLRHSHEMLQALCGLVERYATVVDVEKHANTQPKPLSTEEYQRIHVWGPVLEQDGNALVRSAKLEAFA
jgi:hypothetical protein